MVVAGSWGEEEMSRYYLMGTEVQFCKLKKVLETETLKLTLLSC